MYFKLIGLIKHASSDNPTGPNNHQLFATDKRQLCSHCYQKNVQEMGRKLAKNKTGKTKYRCDACAKHICVDCYFETHASKLNK